jgi:hypothetical protein
MAHKPPASEQSLDKMRHFVERPKARCPAGKVSGASDDSSYRQNDERGEFPRPISLDNRFYRDDEFVDRCRFVA